jgi:hypothetical protein
MLGTIYYVTAENTTLNTIAAMGMNGRRVLISYPLRRTAVTLAIMVGNYCK